MADVARLREADRGQLFLVGALALAVIFVVLAVLLNTAIYTGNIATRDPGPGTTEVVEYENAATAMADRTLADVNVVNNSSYTELESAFRGAVTEWSDTANVHTSAALADAHVSTVATRRGTKIGQTNDTNFTSDSGATVWQVANNSSIRAFQMTVEQSSLGDDGILTNDPEFGIEFSWGTEQLTLYIYNSGTLTNDVTVALYDGGTEISDCSVSAGGDDRVTVDLSGATLAGEDCGTLATLQNRLPASYTTRFENGSYAQGNYSLVVNRELGAFATGADGGAGDPYTAPALYSAELQVTYRSSVTYYRTQRRVAPEELHA